MASATPEIRAIYWDIGGVLLTNGWDHEQRARVLAKFGLERDAFEQRHPEANDRWERGLIDDAEYLRETVFYEPRDFTPEQFLEAIRAESQWLPYGARRVIHALRAQTRLKLAMLNNESWTLNEYRIATFGFADLFDGFYCSAYVGMRKPEPRMFAMGAALLNVKPQQSCFVDDREKNVAAAAAVGMHAHQYKDEAGLLGFLRGLGVQVT